MVDWLSDLSWVPNGAVVLISRTAAAAATAPKERAVPSPPKSVAAEEVAATTGGGSSGASTGASTATGDDAEHQADEDEEEALALAALGRIRESYRTRTKERRSQAPGGRGTSDVSDEEAGKRMMEKRREVENTAQSRQASVACGTYRVLCSAKIKKITYVVQQYSSMYEHELQATFVRPFSRCGSILGVLMFFFLSAATPGSSPGLINFL